MLQFRMSSLFRIAQAIDRAPLKALWMSSFSSHAASEEQPRFPLPPFTLETARMKVQLAEDAWNTKDPVKVSQAYTLDSKWRNRDEIFEGREAILNFLKKKWQRELGYRLKKELWSYTDHKIAVKFEYEWHNEEGVWTRSYGCELWLFAADGRMAERHASINDAPVAASDLRRVAHPGISVMP
ncbi:hypothetical protein CEUSTIGMA_g10514.t1 [Chlamydomonas eustigma]|uniref:DUF4440 domain-containing protein n=1 Tax=Chlamydomonas eustigma TaxID=1157962 RepID=A0A250XJ37_9CHLO|nr:hypothetical protein CEUSTIGMA_g10514.t1 [Chlamydomonas eustigma]|eukprot:GAX83088.1 hypothetical protein CEUSTIGMA_g10514.t1 [Chlamydomonas eustigma]